MGALHIHDFEDGLQDYIGNMVNISYTNCSFDSYFCEPRGYYYSTVNLNSSIGIQNIIILSKPFDCLARGKKEGKYLSEDGMLIWNNKQRLYYDNVEFYKNVSDYISEMDNKFIIHPYELLTSYNRILSRLQDWIEVPCEIQFNINEYSEFYKNNTNQM